MSKSILGLALVFLCTLSNTIGQYFIKLGANIFTFNTLFQNYYLFIGIIIYAISAILLIFALKFGELTVIYPAVSLTFIWVTLLSIYVLHEVIVLKQFFGIFFVLAGVFFVTRGAK
jgi:drug/metabolite transporter (DMT)-like permease